MQHLDEGTIHAWIDGALDAEESARVEQHVGECATCASAVAEARGLVAGASRILAALDDVPSGVVPRSGGGGALGGGSSAPRPRSLWTHLHLTPARAAAAAFLIVAAGTALVMRQASDVAHRGVYSMAAQRGATPAKPVVPATPLPPAPAPTMADSVAVSRGAEARTESRPQLRGDVASAESGVHEARPAASPPFPAPAPPARRDAEEKRAALSQVVVTASVDSAAIRDSRVSGLTATSASDRLDSALRARPKAMNAAVTVVGGAAPTAAPMAARSLATVRRPVSYAGCYSVAAGDSLLAVPKLLSLDTLQLARASTYVPSAVPARFAVSAVTDAGRRPIDTASWQPLLDGVRISFGRTPVDLRQGADSTLSAGGVGGRRLLVTLQRVSCPR